MKKRLVTCAAGLGMLCVFLSISWNARNAHTPREDHDEFTDITSTPSAGSALPSNRDTLMGGLQTKDSWHSENRHWVALYRTSAGETVIRVSSAQEKDAVLQELPVDLPGEIVGISGFFTSCGNGTTDRNDSVATERCDDDATDQRGSGTADDGDEPEIRADRPEVVVFCRGSAGGETRKFLYLWNQESQALEAEPVELPADYVPESDLELIFSRTRQEGAVTRKTLYQVVDGTRDIVPLRSYVLNREEETLEIRDELRRRTLFSGSVLLKEDGTPENEAYFERFFGNFSVVTKPREPDSEIVREEGIPVFVAERNQYGDIRGHAVYYPDREALLSEQGFSGQEPFYRYTDAWGDLELELYYDPAAETGCGFYYSYEFYPEPEEIVTGFLFHGTEEQPWVQYPPYRLENRYGETGKEWPEEGEVLSYEEDCRYRADGRPEYFCAKGLADFYGKGPEETIFLEITFIYRDDGTLAYRKYSHNSWMWGSSYGSGTYQYDEEERLVSESLYVTHGGETYYYIYEDGSNQPAYAFLLDSGGAWGCGLFPVEQSAE